MIASEIMLPPHAPEIYLDRATLWNAVENCEKHPKAQLAYSFDIAMQNELTLEENMELARKFVQEQFVTKGMIADLAFHSPEKEDGGIPNPHFHVMTTMRPLNPDGTWGQKQRREYLLDEDGNRIRDKNGDYMFNAVHTTDWHEPETLEHWREQWAAAVNTKFEEKGLDVRIDHRSYVRQGLDLIPTVHEGANVRQMEAKGIRTEKGELNRWIKATNRLMQDVRKKINVSFPVGVLTCVTGVSGSGKSSLVNEILYKKLARELNRARTIPGKHKKIEGLEQFDKVINIDQSPIGRTPRSNPATYTGVFDLIRDLFASTPDAKARGYKKGRFSFNVKGGRCEACAGDGILKIEMHFLPDVYVPCEVCGGKRYNRETLEVKYKGKSIYDVLNMTVEEAVEFFAHVPSIRRKMETLNDVGLSYIRLGQPSTELSGGEAQRIKLASELSKRSTGRTVYILDEPTTGLHFADVHKLTEILRRLTEEGNTVIVIEHNLDVIKTADYIIDIGPEGGDRGGTVVAYGTPEEVAKNSRSYTGKYLDAILKKNKDEIKRKKSPKYMQKMTTNF